MITLRFRERLTLAGWEPPTGRTCDGLSRESSPEPILSLRHLRHGWGLDRRKERCLEKFNKVNCPPWLKKANYWYYACDYMVIKEINICRSWSAMKIRYCNI